MKKELLQKARELESEIWHTEQSLVDINIVLENYDEFGSSIEFKNNKTGFSRSFGSKKFNFRKDLKALLSCMKEELSQELDLLKEKFDKL